LDSKGIITKEEVLDRIKKMSGKEYKVGFTILLPRLNLGAPHAPMDGTLRSFLGVSLSPHHKCHIIQNRKEQFALALFKKHVSVYIPKSHKELSSLKNIS